MQTKLKPQATHICMQRLIEIRTDTRRQNGMQTQKCIIFYYVNIKKIYIKQIQYK